ncbi:MAG: FAD-binding oxidoreductase [Candidatus Liptonbacteria bacterium]|nr:FAD-binding oxidoreductase [Candidatus Liptonbacteria bacterium]
MATSWQKDIKEKARAPLKGNLEAEVIILGGGITGTVSAYLLANEGKRVILLEAETFDKKGATPDTTAFITHVIDTALPELVKLFGREKAKGVWEAGKQAVEKIEDIVKKEKIDCEFTRVPQYEYALSKGELKEIKEEVKLAKEFGFEAELRTGAPLLFAGHNLTQKLKQVNIFVPSEGIEPPSLP